MFCPLQATFHAWAPLLDFVNHNRPSIGDPLTKHITERSINHVDPQIQSIGIRLLAAPNLKARRNIIRREEESVTRAILEFLDGYRHVSTDKRGAGGVVVGEPEPTAGRFGTIAPPAAFSQANPGVEVPYKATRNRGSSSRGPSRAGGITKAKAKRTTSDGKRAGKRSNAAQRTKQAHRATRAKKDS